MIGDFLLPLADQRKGEADSRSSVPLPEHQWASNYKKTRIPSGATSKPTCFPCSLILCVDEPFPIYTLIYSCGLFGVSRAALALQTLQWVTDHWEVRAGGGSQRQKGVGF